MGGGGGWKRQNPGGTANIVTSSKASTVVVDWGGVFSSFSPPPPPPLTERCPRLKTIYKRVRGWTSAESHRIKRTRKLNPGTTYFLVTRAVTRACHFGSGTNLKADTHEGFCSRSMLEAHFARFSTHEGAFSSSPNLPREFAPKYLTG